MSSLWAEFAASWPLFGLSYLTGWLIAAVLAVCGVVVVAQRQVILGVATTQASALGIALALWLAQHELLTDHHVLHGTPVVAGVLFAVGASLLTTRARGLGENADAVGAFVFAAASALAVLLMAHSPHGLEEVERLMFSTLIGADEHDVFQFAGLAAVVAVLAWRGHRQVLLTATDPATARALGLPTRRIETLLAVVLGLAIGLSMHAAGTLYTFGCLALPPLAARQLCRTMRALFVVAPLLGLAATLVGFVLANGYDYPPGQMAVAVQAGVLVLAWTGRRVAGISG